ncbi:MAG: hypothetical protein QXL16_00385 [Candidatus Micrarchaeaceae archaeon]
MKVLQSLLRVRAHRKCSGEHLILKLDTLPGLKKEVEANEPEYSTIGGYPKFVFVFRKEEIEERILSQDSPLNHLKKAITSLLSLSVILKEEYDVFVEGLYSPMLDALNSLSEIKIEKKSEEVGFSNHTCRLLAKRIISINKEKELLEREIKIKEMLLEAVITAYTEERGVFDLESFRTRLKDDLAMKELTSVLLKSGHKVEKEGRAIRVYRAW